MTPNPYPVDTMRCMRVNDKVSLRSTVTTLTALTVQPTSINSHEASKLRQAIALIEEVLDCWNNHKEQ